MCGHLPIFFSAASFGLGLGFFGRVLEGELQLAAPGEVVVVLVVVMVEVLVDHVGGWGGGFPGGLGNLGG